MEENNYWRLRASEMRERAAHIKDTFISGGFLTLAAQYEQLAVSGARWVSRHSAASPAQPHEPQPHDAAQTAPSSNRPHS